MDKIIKALSSIAPFLEQYPLWVKVLFSVWIFLTATLLLSFILARQPQPDTGPTEQEKGETGKDVWFIIEKVELFGGLNDSQSLVKVVADVNGTHYTYPSLEGIEWMKVGPQMSSQQFRLPESSNGYEIRFSVQVKRESGVTEFVSQQTQVIQSLPSEKTFNLYRKEGATRRPNVEAAVRYGITRNLD